MSVRKRTWTTPKGEEKSAWVVDYVDQHGKRRLKTFARKKEADGFRAKAEHEVGEGGKPDAIDPFDVGAAFEHAPGRTHHDSVRRVIGGQPGRVPAAPVHLSPVE